MTRDFWNWVIELMLLALTLTQVMGDDWSNRPNGIDFPVDQSVASVVCRKESCHTMDLFAWYPVKLSTMICSLLICAHSALDDAEVLAFIITSTQHFNLSASCTQCTMICTMITSVNRGRFCSRLGRPTEACQVCVHYGPSEWRWWCMIVTQIRQ